MIKLASSLASRCNSLEKDVRNPLHADIPGIGSSATKSTSSMSRQRKSFEPAIGDKRR